MTRNFSAQISQALAGAAATLTPSDVVIAGSPADLTSCFDVAGLATASVAAAAGEVGALLGARDVQVDRGLAQAWFDMTLKPEGWALPSSWDPLAGNYRTSDGWVRLHTNAPRHRDAALRVLGCAGDPAAVAAAVRARTAVDLETAIVAAGGAAAAMHSLEDWSRHPQGRAVARDPLIAWSQRGQARPGLDWRGLKVLDLTRVLAGPVATRFLAGYGAEVLRIDPPDWDEPGLEPEVTLGKRCAGLDLRQSEDRHTFETLLARADVLVHGYRPDALAGLGYGADDLRRLAPAAIEVTLNAYGWQGPWSGRRGFDSLVQMSCGIAHEGMARYGGDKPVPLPVQALDHATGYLMAAAVLRAIRVRRQSGTVMSARLSLARTAALMVSAGARDPSPSADPREGAELDPRIEGTIWGPARRVAFPVRVEGTLPHWTRPGGPLRRDPPQW